jgi:hypothetical protein
MPNNICDTKDIIIMLLVLGMIYLLYKTRNIETFSTSDEISQAINDIYKADINAIRNLSNVATEIKNNNDSLIIPAKTTNVTDLIGVNSQFTNITSDKAAIKNITVDGNIIYTNKTNTLGNLGDANITSPKDGNMLIYSNSKWVNVPSIAGCIDGYLTGPWSSENPTNPTSGAPFEVPIAGNYILNVNASAWRNTQGIFNIVVQIFINGVNTNNYVKMAISELNSHKTLIPVSFKYPLKQGTNYFFLRQFTGMSDINDFATLNYIYSP